MTATDIVLTGSIGGGAQVDAVAAGAAPEAGEAVGADGDLEGHGSGRHDERERLADDRRKFERDGGGLVGMVHHAHLDETGWAMASVEDDDFPAIFPERLVPRDADGQAFAGGNAAVERAQQVEDLAVWNGHVPLVSRRTGRFIGWVVPPARRPRRTLPGRVVLLLRRLLAWLTCGDF